MRTEEKSRYLRTLGIRAVRAVVLYLIAGSVLFSGCGPKDEDKLNYNGPTGQATAIDVVADTAAVQISLKWNESDPDFEQGLFLLDTGSPVTLADGPAYGLSTGVRTISEIRAFSLNIYGLKVAVMPLFGGASELSGILGGNVLKRFTFALDYRGGQGWLFDEYEGTLPVTVDETADPLSVDFSLLGGGVLALPNGDEMKAFATRVTVTAELEEHVVTAVVDTGASAPVLDSSLAAQLLVSRPDRPMLEGIQVMTVDGVSDAYVTRATRLAVGDAEVRSVSCLVPDNTTIFFYISQEIGRPVSMLIGGSFLRYFFTVIDFPGRKLLLSPYTSTPHVNPDEYVSVGFLMEEGPGMVWVALVYPDTDAELKGVWEGDEVTAIDGQAVTTLPQALTLVGAHGVGAEVGFSFLRAATPYDATVLVEDLLPEFLE